MKKIIAAVATLMMVGAAQAADITNADGEPITLVITENGVKTEVIVAAGETQALCAAGCFVTFPDGDRAALSGGETVTITGGKAAIN